jgi:hypothetical protein
MGRRVAHRVHGVDLGRTDVLMTLFGFASLEFANSAARGRVALDKLFGVGARRRSHRLHGQGSAPPDDAMSTADVTIARGVVSAIRTELDTASLGSARFRRALLPSDAKPAP